jgi:hypothetical protein
MRAPDSDVVLVFSLAGFPRNQRDDNCVAALLVAVVRYPNPDIFMPRPLGLSSQPTFGNQ